MLYYWWRAGHVTVTPASDWSAGAGIALGVARRQSSAWFLLLAFASHKWVISGCLGLKWARSPVGADSSTQCSVQSM